MLVKYILLFYKTFHRNNEAMKDLIYIYQHILLIGNLKSIFFLGFLTLKKVKNLYTIENR